MKKISPTFSWQPLLQRCYPIALFCAVGLLAWVIASSIWLAIAPPTAVNLPPIALTPPPPKNTNTNQFDIFAKPTTAPINQPPPDIRILGVTVAQPEAASYAILASGGKTLSYRFGDMIGTSQYKLTKVTLDYIVVTAPDGSTQKIDFGQKFLLDQTDAIRAKAQNSPTNPNNTAVNGINNPTIQHGSPQPAPMPANPTNSMTNSVANSIPSNPNSNVGNNPNSPAQAALSNAATALQQNPASYLNSMGVTATAQGYQVTDAMPAGLRARLGLQSGDKVISVNGQNVGQNPNTDAQILQQVQQSGNAQIQVQRGEQVITIRQSL